MCPEKGPYGGKKAPCHVTLLDKVTSRAKIFFPIYLFGSQFPNTTEMPSRCSTTSLTNFIGDRHVPLLILFYTKIPNILSFITLELFIIISAIMTIKATRSISSFGVSTSDSNRLVFCFYVLLVGEQ